MRKPYYTAERAPNANGFFQIGGVLQEGELIKAVEARIAGVLEGLIAQGLEAGVFEKFHPTPDESMPMVVWNVSVTITEYAALRIWWKRIAAACKANRLAYRFRFPELERPPTRWWKFW